MAAYKKKNIKKLQPSKERRSKIQMKQSNKSSKKTVVNQPRQTSFKVVTGGRTKRKNGVLAIVLIVMGLIIFNSVFTLIHPIGITEYFSALYKSVGSGKGYPVTLGSEEIISVNKTDSAFYLLNQSDLQCYNINGKVISKVHHGLSKPVLSTSETRAIVYGQGEKILKIYNYDKEIASFQFEKELLSADIADNGNYAVASYADAYDSVVKVYNKKNEPLYEWYSASGIVSNIRLLENGKKLLVVTFDAENGVLKSKIQLLNFKSADAEYVYSFDNGIPYDIIPISNNKFYVIFEKSVELIDIKHGLKPVNSSEYSNRIFIESDGKILLAGSLSATVDNNKICLIDKKGNVLCDINADFAVNDVAFKNNFIFVLGNSEIIKLDRDGNILSSTEVSFDTKKIIPISERYVVAVSNNIEKIELKDGIDS